MHTLYFIGDAGSGFQIKVVRLNCEKKCTLTLPKRKEYKNSKLQSNPLTYLVQLGLDGQ